MYDIRATIQTPHCAIRNAYRAIKLYDCRLFAKSIAKSLKKFIFVLGKSKQIIYNESKNYYNYENLEMYCMWLYSRG